MTDEKTFDNITMSKLSVDDADTSITLKPPFTQKKMKSIICSIN